MFSTPFTFTLLLKQVQQRLGALEGRVGELSSLRGEEIEEKLKPHLVKVEDNLNCESLPSLLAPADCCASSPSRHAQSRLAATDGGGVERAGKSAQRADHEAEAGSSTICTIAIIKFKVLLRRPRHGQWSVKKTLKRSMNVRICLWIVMMSCTGLRCVFMVARKI